MDKVDKRFADKIGVEYELFPLASPHYNELQRKVAEIAGNYRSSNPVIVEIGCGTGLTTLELYKIKPNADITAIDAEEIMVEKAKEFLKDAPVKIICVDALEYLKTLKEKSVDIVASAFCLHNTPPDYRRKVFEQIGYVLKSEGLCINGDKIALDNEMEHKETLQKQIEAFSVFKTTQYPELQEEWSKHYLEDDKIKLTEKEQRELFEIAGCKNIKLHNRWMMDTIFSAIKI